MVKLSRNKANQLSSLSIFHIFVLHVFLVLFLATLVLPIFPALCLLYPYGRRVCLCGWRGDSTAQGSAGKARLWISTVLIIALHHTHPPNPIFPWDAVCMVTFNERVRKASHWFS